MIFWKKIEQRTSIKNYENHEEYLTKEKTRENAQILYYKK